MDFYLQGLALGLAYVAPIGMQNLFVINSALTQTRWRALKVSALADIKQMLGLGQTVWQACVVTWFNAQAVINGTMLLGAFKATMNHAQSLHFLFGVISASCLWFISLALIVSLAGSLITPRTLNLINKICGTVIIIYDIKLFWHFAEMV